MAGISALILLLTACSPTDPALDLDSTVPVEEPAFPYPVERTPAGEALTPAEVTAFTRDLTAFWKRIDLWRWVGGLTHGYEGDAGPTFGLWFTQTVAVRSGASVTFDHRDWEDNHTIPTSKWLTVAAAAYLRSGDLGARDVLIRQSRGLSALFDGMVWGEPPTSPSPFLARAVYPPDQSYTSDHGPTNVSYAAVRHASHDWNAHTVENPDNPFWGPIWLRNIRSKDDVGHIYRACGALLEVLAATEDAEVIAALQPAVDHLRAFAADIAANDWTIRSVEGGEVFSPTEDLARLNLYAGLEPDAECPSRLATALIADLPFDEDCNDGIATLYEELGGRTYYNVAISRSFHMAALHLAVLAGEDEVVHGLMDGMITRMESALDDERVTTEVQWNSDNAAYPLLAAAGGMPLTNREARLVHEQYRLTLDRYASFAPWDLWADDLADGTYGYLPGRPGEPWVVGIEEIAFPLLACAAPMSAASPAWIDCEVVNDPARWGE